MTEDQLEQEALGWLQDVGYAHRYGPDIAHDGPTPERANYHQVLLPFRLREAIHVNKRDLAGRKPVEEKMQMLVPGATLVGCKGFGDAIIANM